MSTRTMDFALELGLGAPFSLVACRLTEGMSELTHAEVDVAAREELDVGRALTTVAILQITLDGFEARRWTLKVGRMSFLGVEQGSLRYRIELHEALWLLGFSQDTRKFRNQKTEAIVDKVLGAVPHAWHTTRACDERSYCVQYQETNLAFVSRLLEFEGIYHTVDADGTLLLADRSSASPEIEGVFELLDAAGALDRDVVGVHEIRRGAKVTSGKATVNDWDWKKPQSNLLASASADGDTDLEIYDYPTGYRNAGQGAQLAQLRVESLRAGASYVEGRGNAPSFAPGTLFSFEGDGGFAGQHLLTHVEHRMEAPGYGSTTTTYENRFRAIPRAVPFRPPLSTPRPTIAGNHTAMVRGPAGEEIHTDAFGRFRAQFHWDREAKGTDEDSRWVRMLQESATSMVLARVGWEISAGYIDGDPDRPIGLARHINGVMTPTYGLPDRQTRMTIKTPTYPGGVGFNEWRMEDAAGVMHMDVRAERDLNARVQHDKTEKIGNNETHTVVEFFQHDVERSQQVHIGVDSTLTVNKEDRLTVQGNRRVKVGASEHVKVKDAYTVTVGGNDSEKVGSTRITIAGGIKVNIPSPKEILAGAAQGAISGSGLGGPAADALSGAVSGTQGGGGALHGAMGGLLGGSLGSGGGLGGLMSGSGGAAGALGGMMGGGGGGAAGALGGMMGGSGGGAAGALGGMMGGSGGAAGAFGGMMGGRGGAAGGLGGLMGGGGGLGGMLGAGGASLSGAAQGAMSGALDSATHGLASGVSLDKLIDTFCTGSIDRSAQKHMGRTVGGAYVAVALGNVSTNVGYGYAETVGGVKLTLAGGGISENVAGPLALTVGGLLMRKSKGDMSVTSAESKVSVGGMAKLSSKERIELHGEEIAIEAGAELALKTGGLLIKLGPGKLSIEGKLKVDAGDKIVVSGNKDILT